MFTINFKKIFLRTSVSRPGRGQGFLFLGWPVGWLVWGDVLVTSGLCGSTSCISLPFKGVLGSLVHHSPHHPFLQLISEDNRTFTCSDIGRAHTRFPHLPPMVTSILQNSSTTSRPAPWHQESPDADGSPRGPS